MTVHQSLFESLLEKGLSNTTSFIGLSACQLQAVEQFFFAVYRPHCKFHVTGQLDFLDFSAVDYVVYPLVVKFSLIMVDPCGYQYQARFK